MAETQNVITCEVRVGVIGATGFVGECLLPLLVAEGYDVAAFSRSASTVRQQPIKQNITWHLLSIKDSPGAGRIAKWVCLAPIWALPDYFSLLTVSGAERIVAVSSTSRFTKELSTNSEEIKLAEKLKQGEEVFISWAKQNNVQWTTLRPTLIYGLGRDKNISVITRFIRKFSFFPLLGEAQGLRQPVHARDVALACVSVLNTEKTFNRSYNISGGEILTYREMVERIFKVLNKKPRFIIFPLWLFRLAIFFLRVLPPSRNWSLSMVERMNHDLIFDHKETSQDFNFSPSPFVLKNEDMPVKRTIND